MADKLRPNIEAIRKRVHVASFGEWIVCGPGNLVWIGMADRPYGDLAKEVMSNEHYPTKQADAEFIANAKYDIPVLINYIALLERKLERS